MKVVLFLLPFLIGILQRSDVQSASVGHSWRRSHLMSSSASSSRLPLVFGRDAPPVASLTSMSTSSTTGGSARIQNSDEGGDPDTEIDEENSSVVRDSDDVESTTSQPISSEVSSSSEKGGNLTATTTTSTRSSTPPNLHADESAPKSKSDDVCPTKRRLFKRKKKLVDPNSSAAVYAKKLKNRNYLNLRRKCLHTSFGFFFATLNHLIPRQTFLPAMILITSTALTVELLRYRKNFGWMNDALHFFLGSQLRKHEMEGKFTGSYYYFMGVTCTAYLFPKTAATMGIIQLALADPMASYFGRKTRHIYWSRIERGFFGIGRNKGVLGFLGGALFCVPFNYRIFSIAQWGPDGIQGGNSHLIAASFLLGAAGAFADLIVPTPAITMPSKIYGIPCPPFHIDDNFVVPIVSGFACTKIFDWMGWEKSLHLAKYILF